MITTLSQYLERVRSNLRLGFIAENEILNELENHIEDEVEEMKETGLSEEEASSTCLKLLGSAKLVARKLYEAHSQGSWRQALMSSMPHLLFALVFVLNWWQGILGLVITLSVVLGIAIYGWHRGKPVWLFSWLGYSLIPVMTAGLLLLYLPRGWSWLTVLLYVPLALWFVFSITIQTIRRDWLYAALMLLPMPIIIGWFLAVGQGANFLGLDLENIRYFAPWIALSFLALAATAAVFIRLRQRWLRVALLLTSGLLSLIMVAWYGEGRLSPWALLLLALLLVGLLLIMAIFERRIRFSKQQPVV